VHMQCMAVCCSVLQCVAACCSVVQCVFVVELSVLCVHTVGLASHTCTCVYVTPAHVSMYVSDLHSYCNTLQHAATKRNLRIYVCVWLAVHWLKTLFPVCLELGLRV